MNRRAIAIAVAGAGCTATPQPYEVLAVADLAPGTQDIAGRLEMLGTGEARPERFTEHMFAAYRVRLPDDAPRRIRLFTPASCDTPHDAALLVWDLGEIRRVGDETHFFETDIVVDGRTVDIDVVTRFAFIQVDPAVPLYDVANLIAVVQDGAADGEPGPGNGAPGRGAGAWFACGAFTRPDRRAPP